MERVVGINRFLPADVAELDDWIKRNAPKMSRLDAIRSLLEIELKAASK